MGLRRQHRRRGALPYRSGDLKASGKAETILANLPHGSGHSTRDIVFTPDDQRMLVSVGSVSNDGEGMGQPPGGLEAWAGEQPLGAAWGYETDRAAVLAFDPDGKNKKLFATGIATASVSQSSHGAECPGARPTSAMASAMIWCPIM